MPIEVSARIGAMIVGVAAARGASAATLERLTGFSAALAADPDARIAIEVENALWGHAAQLTGDPYFGLHASTQVRTGMFDVLDYVVRTAPTIDEALARLIRYNRLVHSAAEFHRSELGDRVRIEHQFAVPGRAPNRHASEFTLASVVVIARQLCAAPVVPFAVELPSPTPEDAGVYVDVFGVLPRFGSAVGALELSRDVIARPCPNADPALSEVILRHANASLATRPGPDTTFVARIRRAVSLRLSEGTATLELVAKELHMSERSLQRRLAEEQATFDDVVDALRRELAVRYLKDKTLAIGDIAYLLGYSQSSAFHRAFKRWTGSTPTEARAAM